MEGVAFFIGIDPGVSGGIAYLDHLGTVINVRKMPATHRDLLDWLVSYGRPRHAVLERVSSSPQMGVVSAFTFGKGYGAIQMALTAAGVSFDEVTPQTWQRAMGCLSGGDKNITKRRAQALFPGVTVTHAIADALLLAEFCRRFYRALGTPREKGQHGEESKEGDSIKEGAAKFETVLGPKIEGPGADYRNAPAIGAASESSTGNGGRPERTPRSHLRGDRGRASDDQQGSSARSGRHSRWGR